MKLSHSALALALTIASAQLTSACPTASTTTSVALAAPVVVTEPFAVPVATFVQPQALITPTVVTPTIATPTIVTPTIVPAVPQTVVVKEVVRHPRPRVKITRTVTRSR
jgi:hypothetical protein